MSDLVGPPVRLMEQITAQQAHIADLHRALATAERAVGLTSTVAAGTRAYLRADAALMHLEAAEATLDRLLLQHARTTASCLPQPRRHPAIPVNQDALFDVG